MCVCIHFLSILEQPVLFEAFSVTFRLIPRRCNIVTADRRLGAVKLITRDGAAGRKGDPAARQTAANTWFSLSLSRAQDAETGTKVRE